MDRPKRRAVALGLSTVTIGLAGCTHSSAWEWKPGDDGVAPDVHYYYEYPASGEFALGENSALVRFTSLGKNRLVPESDGALAWVYTPAEVEIIDPGLTGGQVGATLQLAIPGGAADGVSHAGLWVFDKAEIDRHSTYVISWSDYDYPGFDLDLVLDYLYETRGDGETLVRLQDDPGGEPAGEVFDLAELIEVETDPEVVDVLEAASGT